MDHLLNKPEFSLPYATGEKIYNKILLHQNFSILNDKCSLVTALLYCYWMAIHLHIVFPNILCYHVYNDLLSLLFLPPRFRKSCILFMHVYVSVLTLP